MHVGVTDPRPAEICALGPSIRILEDANTGVVSVWFTDLAALDAWLLEAHDRVQLLKAELANLQPAPVCPVRQLDDARIGEPIDLTRCADTYDGRRCERPAGHPGFHDAAVADDDRYYRQGWMTEVAS